VAQSEEEDDPGWAKLGQRSDNSSRQGKILGKRKKINGLPGNFGLDYFWAALRKRKRFSDFDSRNDIQI
jgi:hypothetical protein